MKKAGLIITVLMILPALAHADLININTADAALLDTLPGIGPTYAARIVDYRTAHGPFAQIEDVQNVSGIGPSTFAQIKPFITVSEITAAPTAPTSSETAAAASTTRAASPYVPPPAALTLELEGAETANLDVPLLLSAHVTAKGGAQDPSAQVLWSFGDGSSLTGTVVEKTYRYPGTYLVTATAVDGSAKAHADLSVTVAPAVVRMLPVTNEGVTLANDSIDRLDLSGWRLLSGTGSFRFPEGTAILPGAQVLFPTVITNLPFEAETALLYPDGIVAARPAAPAAAQPPQDGTGSEEVQAARPDVHAKATDTITSRATNIQPHAEAVLAPAAAAQPAAAGAAPVAKASTSVLRSPWTLSLLGVIAAAGGAFILL